MRIIIDPGQNGLTIPVIQSIFSFLHSSYVWYFKEYSSFSDFENRVTDGTFPNDHVIFCGITYNNGLNHVFLIGYDSASNYWVIDGQIPTLMCNIINDKNCYNSLKNAKKWYILEYM